MTLAQLRYTIAIAKAGSMNEAAKSLYISQPSLSTAIRELEAETGVEIFRRTNRGIAVTPAGEEFLGYARQVVEQYELMEAKYISKEQSRKIQCFHAALYFRGQCLCGAGKTVWHG